MSKLTTTTIFLLCLTLTSCANFRRSLQSQPLAINLATAAPFAILSETGITDVPTSLITGNVGSSPITGTATLLNCAQVNGTIYDVSIITSSCFTTNASLLTQAVIDMTAAYTEAQDLTPPLYNQLGAGQIGSLSLTSGLYSWTSNLLISTNVTLSGSACDVFVFQVGGNLTVATSVNVILTGGLQAANIFWAVAGTVASIGTNSTFQGTILAKNAIAMGTGATINGRLLAQTAVTLESNTVILPSASSLQCNTSTPIPPANSSTPIPPPANSSVATPPPANSSTPPANSSLPTPPATNTSAPTPPTLICNSSCKNCSGCASNCTSCQSALYFLSANQCQLCSVGCNGCSLSSTNCTSCTSGYVKQPNSNACALTCPTLYQVVNGTCNLICNPSCNGCSLNATNCTSCASGFFQQPNSTLCANTCPSGYQNSLGVCIVLVCQNSSFCQSCLGTSTNCTSCITGYELVNNSCNLICQSPCGQCSGPATNCTSCQNNFFLSGNECLPCSGTCVGCMISASQCIKCAPQFAFFPNSLLCQPICSCNDGYYFNQEQLMCVLCDSSCSTCKGNSTNCNLCASGFSFEQEINYATAKWSSTTDSFDQEGLCLKSQQYGWVNQTVNWNNQTLQSCLNASLIQLQKNGGCLSQGNWTVSSCSNWQIQSSVDGCNHQVVVNLTSSTGLHQCQTWTVSANDWSNSFTLSSWCVSN